MPCACGWPRTWACCRRSRRSRRYWKTFAGFINGPAYTAYAKLCNDFHERLLELSANLVLREITDLLYYRAARVWLAFLPNVDWKEALQTLENEIGDTLRCLELDDIQGVGNVRRQYLYMLLKTIGRYLAGD